MIGRSRNRRRETPVAPRVLLAEDDDALRIAWAEALTERCPGIVVLHAANAAAANDALLLGHPDLVITSLRLSGHAQGGYRVLLDAASLGVPAVLVSGPIAEPLRRRLDELGLLWIARDTVPAGLALAALALLPSVPQVPSLAPRRDEAFIPAPAPVPLPSLAPREGPTTRTTSEVRVPLQVVAPAGSLAEAV